jgi:hypothetical protein
MIFVGKTVLLMLTLSSQECLPSKSMKQEEDKVTSLNIDMESIKKCTFSYFLWNHVKTGCFDAKDLVLYKKGKK